MTGDGRGVVAAVQGAADGSGTANLRVMLATGIGFAPAATWGSSAREPQPFDTTTLRLVAGDFNADRRADAALIRVNPGDAPRTDVLVATSTGRSFGPARVALSVAEDLSTSRFLVGDTTEDGRADLVILRPISPQGVPP